MYKHRPEGFALPKIYNFSFGSFTTRVFIRENLPEISELRAFTASAPCLAVCDEQTGPILTDMLGGSGAEQGISCLELPSGEENKGWAQVERILKEARGFGLGRDGLFLAVGGGVLCDMTAFAASVYMRGAKLVLVPTTLLAMTDAAIGGKTGFDLDGLKNIAGTFYPADGVFISTDTLKSLPEREWKSGMAEIIKAAVLDGPDALKKFWEPPDGASSCLSGKTLEAIIARAVEIKGRVVEDDPRETKNGGRALLNLGHSFGHALESAAGLGVISHGEAVAWGMARSCELGAALGITSEERAKTITDVLSAWGYDTAAVPGIPIDVKRFREALLCDKKKKAGKLRFVVPNGTGAELIEYNNPEGSSTGYLEQLITKIAQH
jgi:3-dehydroquinate synthase